MKIRATLAVLVLGALTLLTGCGDKEAASQPAPGTSGTPGAPPATKAAAGSSNDFCKKLADAAEISLGMDVSKVSDDEMEKVQGVVLKLAEDAPSDLKPVLQEMAKLYSSAADELDEAEKKKAAEASITYVEWVTTNCDAATFGN